MSFENENLHKIQQDHEGKPSFLVETAEKYLDTSCLNWRNYDQPQSYIISNLHVGEKPLVGDETVEIVKNALQNLIGEEFHPPFVAIRTDGLHANCHSIKILFELLQSLFPSLSQEELFEIMEETGAIVLPIYADYDFVIMGPNVGILFIKIASNVHMENNFSFPIQLCKQSFDQLESAHGLVYLLQKCTGVFMPRDWDWDWECGNCVTKLILTPFLEEAQFKRWFDCLPIEERTKFKNERGPNIWCYKGDLINREEHSEKPPFYSSLKIIFEKYCTPISTKMYETFIPVISAMSFVSGLFPTAKSGVRRPGVNQLPIKFIGPAFQEFDSLCELSTNVLDNYWKNWRNYKNPTSHIIPPTFTFKHPDVSDVAFETFQHTEVTKTHEVITDRIADEAEHIVYDAIQRIIIEKKIQTPFIAVRGLNLFLNFNSDKKLQGKLTAIFPHVSWDKFQKILTEAVSENTASAEYDFILIGPEIGIVVIEVKSSYFMHAKHFKGGLHSLPSDYNHALQQLNSIQALIYLFQECTSVYSQQKDICARKILFARNLSQQRYFDWLAKLSESDKNYLRKKIDNTQQWFKEDTINPHEIAGMPLLYEKLLEMLKNSDDFHLGRELYEAYAPIIVGMPSLTMLPSEFTSIVQLEKLNFFLFDTFLKESMRITSQNPFKDEPARKLASASTLKRATLKSNIIAKKLHALKVFVLSSDQQAALNGPSKQFILGAAGTGKTIVLQTKTIELLSKGEPVTVLAPWCYMDRYKLLFDKYGFRNYKVLDLEKETSDLFQQLAQDIGLATNAETYVMDVIQKCVYDQCNDDFYSKYIQRLIFLNKERHIMIDDAFDGTDIEDGLEFLGPARYLLLTMIIFAYAQQSCLNKFVWVAADPHIGYIYPHSIRTHYNDTINKIIECKNRHLDFVVTPFSQVMRCSGNVFRMAYNNSRMNWHRQLTPRLGHKIEGVAVTRRTRHCHTIDEALEMMWKTIKEQKEQLNNQGSMAEQNTALIYGTFFNSKEIEERYPIQNQVSKCWTKHKVAAPDETPRELTAHHEPDCPGKSKGFISDWSSISSLEFPIVISCCCLPKLPTLDLLEIYTYARYRALSRATVKLFDLTITYDYEETLAEASCKT